MYPAKAKKEATFDAAAYPVCTSPVTTLKNMRLHLHSIRPHCCVIGQPIQILFEISGI